MPLNGHTNPAVFLSRIGNPIRNGGSLSVPAPTVLPVVLGASCLVLSVRFHKFDNMIGLLEILSFARSAQDKLTLAGLRPVLERSEGNDIFRLVTLNEVKSLNSTHARICDRNYEQKHLVCVNNVVPLKTDEERRTKHEEQGTLKGIISHDCHPNTTNPIH